MYQFASSPTTWTASKNCHLFSECSFLTMTATFFQLVCSRGEGGEFRLKKQMWSCVRSKAFLLLALDCSGVEEEEGGC